MLLLLVFAALPVSSVHAQEPRAMVEWLRTLTIEARMDLKFPTETTSPRLFTQTVEDGRTWLEFIADSLGTAAGGDPAQPGTANQWALLDEGVSILLAEADTMRGLAVQAAGTPEEAGFQEARKQCLAGAARLLGYLKVAACDVFDSTAGPLAGVQGLPDWLLPGEIRITEVSGAARLNTDSGQLSGRLSGQLELPEFGATLTVPNASFDSAGNLELSAFGTVPFEGGQLSVPARQPLHFRSSEERGLSLDGSARLSLDNGMRFDASVSLQDPVYCFGLSARGLELDLGRSLAARIPVLNTAQVNTFGDQTRDAFADYFKDLNGAMETLLNAAVDFPPIEERALGQPPEFAAPEITLDLSVLSAWSGEIIANTRAGLVNAQQSLQPVLDSLQQLNADARAATNSLADQRARLANLAARLELRRRMREASDLAAQQQAASPSEASQLQTILRNGAIDEVGLVSALITPDLPDRLGESIEVATLLIEASATLDELGIPAPDTVVSPDPCVACMDPAASPVQRAHALALCASRRQILRHGMDPLTGAISDPALFQGLSEAELYRTGRLLAGIEGGLRDQGLDVEGQFIVFLGPLLERQRELVLEELLDTASLGRCFELQMVLTENISDADDLNIVVDNNGIFAQVQAAMTPRLKDVPAARIDAARAEATQAVAARHRRIQSEVERILGRRRPIGVIRPGDRYQPDFLTQLDQFFRILDLPMPEGVATNIDAYVRFKVDELRARPFTTEFLTNRLADSQNIAQLLIGLTDWADLRLTNDLGVLQDLQLTVSDFSLSLGAAAELQRAWWWVDRYQEALRRHTAAYGANLDAGLRLAETRARDAALLSAGRIAGAFGGLVDNLVTQQEVRVPLPGQVEVSRIFGKLCLDRSDGRLGGCFGGRVEFPEVGTNVFFDIAQACLNIDGSYLVQASTALPLPFGEARLASSLDVSGSPEGLATFAGVGTLTVPNGDQGERVFDVSLRYDDAQHRLGFDAQGDQLDLRFGDDFVIFDAGFGFELSTDAPIGLFRAGGSAGLFARQHPPPSLLSREDFHLVVEDMTAFFAYSTGGFALGLTNGTLHLPELFQAGLCELEPGETGGPLIALGPGSAIGVQVGAGPDPAIGFSGALDMRNLGFTVPGLPDLGMEICSARLMFDAGSLPSLTNLQAAISLPLPDQPVLIDVSNGAWGMDGFPVGTLSLRSSLTLVDLDGFTFSLPGADDPACGEGTSLTISRDGDGTFFALNGGARLGFSPSILSDEDGGSLALTACGGFLAGENRAPRFELDALSLSGTFRLGGPDGVRLKGARTTGGTEALLTLEHLENVFARTDAAPFVIRVEGAIEIAGFIEFGLEDARFVWDDNGSAVPRFVAEGLYSALGDEAIELAGEFLPLYPTLIGLRFEDEDLALVPAPGERGLFDPLNLIAIVSGVVSLPNGAAIAGGSPGFSGSVEGVEFRFRRENGLILPEAPNLDGLCLQVENLDLPPLGGITGGICIGNLQALADNRPQDLYFAGILGAKYQDIGAEVLLAVKPTEFIGTCFSLNAGPAGIPIDGGTLGGILLTGARGGINFKNSFSDPCDFSTYIELGEDLPAPGTPERPGNPPEPPETIVPPDFHGVSCVDPPFPPMSINPLCEISPVTGRIVFKGTRLTEAQLIGAGVTSDALAGLDPEQVIHVVLNPFRDGAIDQFIEALTFVDQFNPPQDARAYFERLGLDLLNSFDEAATTFLREVFRAALNADPDQPLYDIIVAKAAEGIPCLDVTLKLEGTFSHAAISTVLSGSGSVTLSSTGTAALEGRVNMGGIPVGDGTFAWTLTDSQGAINPSFGGLIEASIGPLEYGSLSMALTCDGCFGVVAEQFAAMLGCQGGALSAAAAEFAYQMLDRTFRDRAPHNRGILLVDHFNALTTQQQVAFVGGFFNVFQAQVDGVPLAAFNLTQQTLDEFLACFQEFLVNTLPEVNPLLCYSGEVAPKLFGFPLTGGADAQFAATMFYRRQIEEGGEPYQEIAAGVQYSPTYMLLAPLLAVGGGASLPVAIDQASISMALRVPAWTAERVRLALTNPVAYAQEQMTTFLNDAVFGFGYQFQPLGLKLADGQGRVILPRVDLHPNRPGVDWDLPSASDVADRAQVILAALNQGLLQDATWRGAEGELDDLFMTQPLPGTCAALIADSAADVDPAAMDGFSLARDYFPHGGFIGGGEFSLPSVIADAPPVEHLAALGDFSDPARWLTNAQLVFEQYLTKTTCAGQLAFYLPAPNPPADFPWDDNDANAFIESMRALDFASVIARNTSDLYPIEEMVFGGWMSVPLFGTPLGLARVNYDANQQCFQANAQVPADTWLGQFINGTVDLTLKAPKALEGQLDPRGSVEFFQEHLDYLLSNPEINEPFMRDTAQGVADFMPRGSFEALAHVQIPPEFAHVLQADAGAEFKVFGFSPFYEPDFDPGNPLPSPYALARRNGGFGLSGAFELGFFPSGVPADQHLRIEVTNASFAIFPDQLTGFFPALAGQLAVENIQLPNLFSFNGQTSPPLRIPSGLVQFNSSPLVGETFLAVQGAMTPIDLGPFLQVRPLPADANPEDLLGGTLRVARTATGASMAMSLNPAEAFIPMFGSSLRGLIYGSFDQGQFTPFTFSTIPGQAWEATVRLEGAVEIRSPLDPDGPVLFRAAPPFLDEAPIPFEVQVAGQGLDQFELRLTIPNGVDFTLFPGTDVESRFVTDTNVSATCLFVSRDGRVYFDSGTRTLDVNGLASVTGRIELGFEPVDRTPDFKNTRTTNFVTRLGGSHEQIVRVSNNNPNASQLFVDATVSDTSNFSVLPNRLLLGPEETGELRVRFTPRTPGTFARQLILSNNAAQPMVVLPITGIVQTLPRMHVHTAGIDFGLTPLGTSRSQAVRVSNLGDATLALADIEVSNPAFSVDASSANVSPGGTRDLLVSFTPVGTNAVAGLLTLQSNDPQAPSAQVTLNGRGTASRFWYRQRRGDGADPLAAIAMNSAQRGVAVGRDGNAFDGERDGRLWRRDPFPGGTNLTAAVFQNSSTGWVAGASGLLLKTTSGGINWTRLTSGAVADPRLNWRGACLLSPNGGLVLVGEGAGNAQVVVEDPPGTFTAASVPADTPPLNGVVFADSKNGVAVGDRATVLRTTDGGKVWTLAATDLDRDDTNAFRAVAAHDTDRFTYILAAEGGLILRTTDGGQNWSLTGDKLDVDLHAAGRAGGFFYVAGDGGVVLRAPGTGVSWTDDSLGTSGDFRGMGTRGGEVWAVTDQGDIFHRRTNVISGPVSVVTVEEPLRTEAVAEDQLWISEIVIANAGTSNLVAEIRSNNGDFEVLPKDPVTLPPDCQALFTVSFQERAGGAFGATLDVTSSDPDLGGTLNLDAFVLIRTVQDFTPLGYAQLPRCLELGAIMSDSKGFVVDIPVTNIGQATLTFHNLTLRTPHVGGVHTLRATSDGRTEITGLDPGEGGLIHVEYAPPAPGIYRGQIEVASDAQNGVASIDFAGEVVAVPRVVVLDSVPRGISLQVSNVTVRTVTTPAALTVVPGVPGAGQIRSGTAVRVVAPASHSADGVPYEFQRWDPGTGAALTFTAGTSARKFTAAYARTLPEGEGVVDPPIFVASPCKFLPPTDVAFGPWVKITQAKLTLPWLGDGGSGSEFQVEGAMFLSLGRAYGSLNSRRIRVRVPQDAPAFQNVELVEVTPGSWNFDVQSGFLSVAALSPGLQVLNSSALPPTDLRIEVDVRDTSPDRRGRVRFATLDELPLAPGLLAMGPSSTSLEVSLDPAVPGLRLELLGSLRALRRTDGNGWVINRSFPLVLDPQLPSLGLITFSNRTQLADLALLRVHALAGAQIGPTFDGATFSLIANGLGLEFFRSGEYISTSTSFQSDGTYSFSANLPVVSPAGVHAGLVRLKPSTASRTASILANPLQARLAVTFPDLYVNSLDGLWPNDEFAVPGFSFDTADFSFRMPLPSVDFAGFQIEGRSQVNDDNYLEVNRRETSTTLRLRNRQDLFLGALKLAFDVESNGDFSGKLTGRLGLEGPPPLDVVSDRISMRYRSSPEPEFILNRYFIGVPCRLTLGTESPFVGGRACLLDIFTDDPLEDRSVTTCLP